jgi:hypothetical protein
VRDLSRDVVLELHPRYRGRPRRGEGGFTLSRADLGMVNSSWGDNVSDAVELACISKRRPALTKPSLPRPTGDGARLGHRHAPAPPSDTPIRPATIPLR